MLRLDRFHGCDHRLLGGHVQSQRMAADCLQLDEGLRLSGRGVDGMPSAGKGRRGGGADPRRAAADKDGIMTGHAHILRAL